MGNYNEKGYTFLHNVTDLNQAIIYLCQWNNNDGSWSHTIEDIELPQQTLNKGGIWSTITNYFGL